ncbi:exopolysaccharide biosynthesis protein [Modicisalibacter coralii]|uniref:exopolysaccharide biosynthesis protein n=1 Tax=Modicisalibacter coralii TaxID=2304602 RepID=UPI00100B0936|nr:exopolysaccharide biosynthesis protein [Halomonas coralii]
MAERMALTGLLDGMDEAHSGSKLCLQDIVDTFASRGFGPLLVVPALIVVLPTGAIPGIPTLCGLFIAMVAIQLALGKDSPWLPRRLRERGFDHERFHRAVVQVRPWTQRFDRLLKPRLVGLLNPVSRRLIALLAALLALSMMPLELLPFAAALPALAIALMGLGLAAEDGLLMVLGLAVVVIGALVIWRWLLP